MAAKKPAESKPTHYAVRLAKRFPIPGSSVFVPAGESVVSAEVLDQIPAETVLDKTPVEA